MAALKWTEYRFLVVEDSVAIYGGLIAATFAFFGIWPGLKRTGRRQTFVVKELPVAAGGRFAPNERKREDLPITRRELEILELIAQSLSNREIAEKLFCAARTRLGPIPAVFQTNYALDGGRKQCSSARNSALSSDYSHKHYSHPPRNYSLKRMIFLSAAKITLKDDDRNPA